MSVYRFRKVWKSDVYINGKRVATKSGFKSKREATKWYSITLGSYTLKRGEVEESKKYTFEDLLENFERKHLATVRPGTAERYLIDIKYRIKPFFQYYKLSKVSTSLVEEFRARILKDLSRKSVNNCLSLVKIIFKKGVFWKMLETNPERRITKARIKQDFWFTQGPPKSAGWR